MGINDTESINIEIFELTGRGLQVEFDAYIIPINELEKNMFRILDVDTRIVVPFNIHVRILISSADVYMLLNCSAVRGEGRRCPRTLRSI